MFTRSSKTPALSMFQRWLENWTVQGKRYFYQTLMFVLTFLAYAAYHMNRRPFPIVKSVLSPNCSANSINDTCHGWEPFTGSRKDKDLFGLLDFTFMFSYSLSLFVSGYIAERSDLRVFLTCGMILTSLCTSLFGIMRPLGIHSMAYFFIMEFIGGVAQSTGCPAVTEIIGAWIPTKTTGSVFGVWSIHQYVGNIVGNAVSGSFVRDDWSLSFILPALIIFLIGVIIYFILVPDPRYAGIRLNENCLDSNKKPSIKEVDKINYEGDIIDNIQKDPVGISISSVFRIPGLIEFSLCIFFVKFVLYTFFFWLPFMINGIVHNSGEAAYRSSIYDIGCCVGAISAGVIYDYTDTPATICLLYLISGVPTLFQLFTTTHNVTMFTIYMFLAGVFFSGPCTLITTVLAKRPSSKHLIAPNTRSIATLAGVFDGFGSIGSSVGPLVTGFLETGRNSRQSVSYLLMTCATLGAIMLMRQCYEEIITKSLIYRNNISKENGSENENLLEGNKDGNS